MRAQDVVEAGVGARQRAGRAQEARLVVQRQDQARGSRRRSALRRHRRAGGLLPWPARTARCMAASQVFTDSASASRTGPGPVVELDRAADVDAARVDLDRGALHPVGEHARAGAAGRAAPQRGVEHFLLEARVVLADHRDLQFLARAEVGEHARLAHLRDLGQRADRQALQADLRRPGSAPRRRWRPWSAGLFWGARAVLAVATVADIEGQYGRSDMVQRSRARNKNERSFVFLHGSRVACIAEWPPANCRCVLDRSLVEAIRSRPVRHGRRGPRLTLCQKSQGLEPQA